MFLALFILLYISLLIAQPHVPSIDTAVANDLSTTFFETTLSSIMSTLDSTSSSFISTTGVSLETNETSSMGSTNFSDSSMSFSDSSMSSVDLSTATSDVVRLNTGFFFFLFNVVN